eukprot:m.596963 g.596963  ORF g.596963 m.596963 type:complete len:386 (-) comp58060_c0_seq1:96-1253(-)
MQSGLLVALVLLCACGLVSAGYGRFFFNRCFIKRENLSQLRIQAFLRGRQPTSLDPGAVGIIGQHMAFNEIPYLIATHFQTAQPPKPLVLALFGEPGVGKSLFERTIRQHVMGNADGTGHGNGILLFAMSDYLYLSVDDVRSLLIRAIAEQLYYCPTSIIVFDELHLLGPSKQMLFQGPLLRLLGGREPFEAAGYKVDPRFALYFLLSNGCESPIRERYIELRNEGLQREDLRRSHFADLISNFAETQLLHRGYISAFVPFLPMEREQAAQGFEWYMQNLVQRGLGKYLRLHMVFAPSTTDVAECLAFPLIDSENLVAHGLGEVDAVFKMEVESRVSDLLAVWKSSKQPQFLVSAVATDVDTPQEECRIVIELVNAEDNVHSKEL